MESGLPGCITDIRLRRPGTGARVRHVLAHGIAFVIVMSASSIAAAQPCSVAVDAGHTVGNPGASSARGIPEFQFNLALAQALHGALLANDCQVTMVNEDGDIGALKERTAKAGNARLFVSIHHDSVQPHYFETWEFEGTDRHYSDRFSGYSLFVSRDNPFPGRTGRLRTGRTACTTTINWSCCILRHSRPS
jgi:N-acetylmuramoyl-L-alanine amidase